MNTITNIHKIESEDLSDEIFSEIKGEKFFAIKIEENGKIKLHMNKISEEEVVFSCNIAIHKIMEDQ